MIKARLFIAIGSLVAIALILIGPLAAQIASAQASIQGSSSVYLPEIFAAPAAPCAAKPTLVSPTNGAALNTITPLFQWSAISANGANLMTVEISTDTSFDNAASLSIAPPPAGQFSAQIRYPGDLTASTTYYWRVFFTCGSQTSPQSDTWSFTSAPGLLPAPTSLYSPAPNANVAPDQVTFAWSPVSGAINYLVKWQAINPASQSFSFDYTADNSGVTTYSPSGLQPNTQYEWSVAARNDYGVGYVASSKFTTTNATSSGVHRATRQVGRATATGSLAQFFHLPQLTR